MKIRKEQLGKLTGTRREVQAWQDTRNDSGCGMNGQCTTAEARRKLKKL
jgi:hypothetical protein